MSNANQPVTSVEWCRDPAWAHPMAQLFLKEVTPDYISHGEVQLGRADDFQNWADDLESQLVAELAQALQDGNSPLPEVKVAIAQSSGRLVGFALLRLISGRRTYAVLEDLVVAAEYRRNGIGEAIVQLAEAAAAARGAQYVFLESGQSNAGAHRFFAKLGFHECSVVMAKRVHP